MAKSLKEQRAMRRYQTSCRGSKRSYKTELENVQILLAWEAAQLSEGQASSALDVDRVALRMMREGAIADGLRICDAIRPIDRTHSPNSTKEKS